MKFKELINNPKNHIIFLVLLLLVCFCFWQPQQSNDGPSFQKFAEILVKEARVDFSIPGFHGTDFLVALVYLITGSQFSVYFFGYFSSFVFDPFDLFGG